MDKALALQADDQGFFAPGAVIFSLLSPFSLEGLVTFPFKASENYGILIN